MPRRDLVFVGYGIVAPEYDWNDYDGVDVKNKIVVALVNDPGLRDSTIFRGAILTYYGRWTYKMRKHDARAPPESSWSTPPKAPPIRGLPSSPVGPDPRYGSRSRRNSLLVAGWLIRMQPPSLFPRVARTSPSSRSKRLREDSKQCRLVSSSRPTSGATSAARRPERYGTSSGRGPAAQEAVLIGGHYDHFGIGAPVEGDSIYNGAEDNASGTAAV